jgi:hypothetical protein
MTTDNFCFYFQYGLIQTSQTGGERYSNTYFFSIPCLTPPHPIRANKAVSRVGDDKTSYDNLMVIFKAGLPQLDEVNLRRPLRFINNCTPFKMLIKNSS